MVCAERETVMNHEVKQESWGTPMMNTVGTNLYVMASLVNARAEEELPLIRSSAQAAPETLATTFTERGAL